MKLVLMPVCLFISIKYLISNMLSALFRGVFSRFFVARDRISNAYIHSKVTEGLGQRLLVTVGVIVAVLVIIVCFHTAGKH